VAPGLTPALLDPYRPTWAEIDLDALLHNFAVVRRRVGSVPILAVVKANAYGHGAVRVALTLEEAGAACFGVALPEEGVELRRAGVRAPVLLLGGFAPAQADRVLSNELIPAVYRPDQVEALAAAADRRGVRASMHLKIDTGMGRLGVPAAEVPAFATLLAKTPRVNLTGAFSHLAVADDPADPFTARQIALFEEALGVLRSRGINPSQLHLANSAAIMDHPPAWLTLVRPGIVLYGYAPSEKVSPLAVRPALSLKSSIIYLKDVAPGTSLGYGRTFVAHRPMRIASLAIGYDDGLPRLLGNRGYVLVRGRRAPITGRVSMDLTTVDVTDVPGASLGDEAVLIGTSGRESLDARQVAEWAETISWDVLCGIGSRVPRLYLRGETLAIESRFGQI
jgi:alanine racemase